MNLNVITYSIYLPIMIYVTVFLGQTFFKNGRTFILQQFNGDEELTDNINRVLLVGYYLLNLGFCFYIVESWSPIKNWIELLNSLADTIGKLIVGLGLMHFINVSALIIAGKKKRIEELNQQLNQINNH